MALLCGLLLPRPGLAAEPTDAKPAAAADLKTRYGRAVTLYKSGQYDKAIEEFQAVYEMRPETILLFNLAQANRLAGRKAPALELYERFQRENQSPDPKLKSETEQYIGELKAAVAADKVAEQAAAEKAAADKAAADKAALDKAAADKLAAEQAAADFRRRHGPYRPLNLAKWGSAGLGVILVVVGAALIAVDGKPVCGDLMTVPGQRLCPNELATKTGGAVSLGVGIAALGGSAALFYLDARQQREAPKPSLAALNILF